MAGTDTPYAGQTDFLRYDHAQLIQMLSESSPNGVAAAGDRWAAAGRSLHDRANDLSDQLTTLDEGWSGPAATQYRAMITNLAGGIHRIATAALALRDLVYSTGEALSTAWLAMPAAADEAAYREAVLLMTTLAGQYHAVGDAMPATVDGAASPGAGPLPAPGGSQLYPGGTGNGGAGNTTPAPPGFTNVTLPAPAGPPAAGGPGDIVPPGGEPGSGRHLFGGMFTAGIAAASAALGRRYIPSPPSGPLPAPQPAPQPVDPGLSGAPAPGSSLDDAGTGAKPMSFSGSGGSGFDRVSLPSTPGAALDPAATKLPGSSAAGVDAFATGAGVGAVAAATGKPMAGGFVPPMPMGMMGGADAGAGGGGRRIPPWLVETEDIWGESAVVAPSVIGEDADARPAPSGMPPWQ